MIVKNGFYVKREFFNLYVSYCWSNLFLEKSILYEKVKETDFMQSVVVIMSTYNGSKHVVKQLDSIFAQKGVDVSVFVRDDGSKDNTIAILEEYAKTHTVIIFKGENVGWERSFLLALEKASEADYYAFSDQDDIWFENKLLSAIKALEQCRQELVMYHCNKISVDEGLTPLPHQIKRIARPLNRENAIIQEYAQGCSIVINNKTKRFIVERIPSQKIAHDYWIGLLCYLFGKVIYNDGKFFYHISHGTNASSEGHLLKSWKERLYRFKSKQPIYYFPCDDLLRLCNDRLSNQDKEFIYRLKNYKISFKDKMSLMFSRSFVRTSILGTISLKLSILLNRL
jgi:glycosyltransferases involved in cell wall biogenesis